MTRIFLLAGVAAVTLSACAPGPVTTQPRLGADGQPLPRVYDISRADESRILYRMLDAVNTLRSQQGLARLELNSQLRAAAATHSRDMSVQNRPWAFGSDGSSPLDRVRNAGYSGKFLGQAISESFETELETLEAWMDEPGPRDIILDPEAREMGFAWFQESGGKIWWTLVTGAPSGSGPQIAGL